MKMPTLVAFGFQYFNMHPRDPESALLLGQLISNPPATAFHFSSVIHMVEGTCSDESLARLGLRYRYKSLGWCTSTRLTSGSHII